MMNADILRILWVLVGDLSPDKLSELSYELLVKGLLNKLSIRLCLSSDEADAVRAYLSTRELLIRELVLEHSS